MIPLLVMPLALFAILQWSPQRGWRLAILCGAVVWATILVIATEVLSSFAALDRPTVAVFWTAVTLIAALLAARRLKDTRVRPRIARLRLSPMVVSIAMVLIATAMIAMFTAPVGWDTMAYHLPRVAHWIQNSSVDHYPTHIDRQLWIGPGPAYAALHIELLSGSDRIANMLQWAALGGCAMTTSLIARQLGAGRRGQSFAALFAVTIPVAVAQSAGGQVDVIAAFWMSAAVVFLLDIIADWESPRFWHTLVLLGAATGLSVLTKGTAFVFAAPFVVWAIASGLRKNPRRLATLLAIPLAIALAMNAPHFARNMRVFGHPLHPEWGESVFTSSVLPAGIASNVIRNTVLHFGTHNLAADTLIYRGVEKAHRLIGIDVNDRRTTFGANAFGPVLMSFDEHDAGNPLHFLLIVAAGIVLVFFRRDSSAVARKLLLAIVAGFVLYCALLAWQRFGSRFQLPLFMLAAAAVGLAVERVAGRFATAAAATLVVVGAFVTMLFNPLRPIARHPELLRWPLSRQSFAGQPFRYGVVQNAVALLDGRKCNRVGLVLGMNDWEYPLWTQLRRGGKQVELRHIDVPDMKAAESAADKAFVPCAVYTDSASPRRPWSPRPGLTEAWRRGKVVVYFPDSSLSDD